MMRSIKVAGLAVACVAALSVAITYGASYYYTSQHGQGCASCHEMAAFTSAVHASAHRTSTCLDCHDASLGSKLRHIRVHLFGQPPESIRLRDVDVLAMTTKCQNCHKHEYATWRAGPHSATYAQIFTDPVHNAKRRLADDCLRCHGMHFSGAVRELVSPMNTTGPWHLLRTSLADQPTIPCMACHEMHREDPTQSKPAQRISAATAPIPETLAFFDRREQLHFGAGRLAIPVLFDGARGVRISPDPRQAICYQCHAPRQPEAGSMAAGSLWGPQVRSGDDRTPIGVHEGISCFACHNGHSENAASSCKTCHPQMSHCGIDVEKMDTTFTNAKSTHNIHWVRCADCHQQGIPRPKVSIQTAAVGSPALYRPMNSHSLP
ncbi:MAG TPA: multiheme c-type cytochrome [Terracidiphilus sp.]|nr:multiheme c-type cytochrome [Terracidiphilus sp.]